MKKTKSLSIITMFLFLGIFFINSPVNAEAKVYVNIYKNGEIENVTGNGSVIIDKNVTGFKNYYPGNYKNPWQANITKVTVSKNNKYFTSKDGVLYNKKMTRLVYYPSHKKSSVFKLPATVKSIECYAFTGSRYLEKVILNKGLREIGFESFENSNIKTINIPRTVKEIGYGCFSGCRKLKVINNKALLSVIEDNTFRNCISLQKLDIDSSVNWISGTAFYNCGAMINIPAGNKNYITKDGVLYSADMEKLLKYPGLKGGSFAIPGTIRSISPYTFTGCRKLKSLEINGYIKEFPLSWLNGCVSLEMLSLPENLKSVGSLYKSYNNADGGLYTMDDVYGLASLREIKVHKDNLYFSVYDNALYSNGYEQLWLMPHAKTSLKIHKNTHYILDKCCQNQYKEITVPDSNKYFTSYKGVLYDKEIKTIEVFPGSMESYEIPVSLKNADVIINYAIYEEGYKRGCYVKGFNNAAPNLKSITVEKGNNYFSSKDGVLFNLKMTKIYLYPRARKGKYIIPGTVKKMDDNTFAGAHKLTGLVIPSSIKDAGINIAGCTMLENITFKEGVKKVYMYGGAEKDFYGFTGKLYVKNIYLPSTAAYISVYGINQSAVFYAYNNIKVHPVDYYEDERDIGDAINVKDYITSKGYVCKNLGTQ